MKLAKRVIIGMLTATMLFSAMPASIPDMLQMPVMVEASETAEIEPKADVVYWMYRVLSDGTIQKRRWNATRGYWVDPDWIDVN
ncbi:MAG TPA: hypothetical protein H9849_04165 [Candidatus Anaerobutyricum stercoripullorum]|uniref:Uncharacterized protein n=1 Tax=Candidatus Anaerobutyricum stercoripullorum TaxID=2838456 RepID=A0A9D1X433_9FIRM|nr:hypothetical protein [Candidatus Anaerobutyricum stercoripullorum]